MDNLAQLLVGPLQETFFVKALIGGSIVAVVCGVVGCLVILRRMAFLGDALAHAMIAGVGGGYLAMKLLFGVEAHAPGMLIGSLIAAVITVALIGFVSRVSRIKEDTAIGIMYVGVFAVGVVLVSIFRQHIHIDLVHFIMGDVLGVADADLWIAAFVAAAVLSIMILFFRQFQMSSFDPVMAAAVGIPVVFFDYLLTTCVSMVVVSAVTMVGVILVVGLLVTPAATAYLLSERLQRMMVLAGLFGVTSVVGGLYLCMWFDSSGGGAIMLFSTLQFLTVLVVSPRYGLLADWRRRWRFGPQEIKEDILHSMLRFGEQPMPLSVLGRHIPVRPGKLRLALQAMGGEGFVRVDDSNVLLTQAGRAEAVRFRRSHRLWESYLQGLGVDQAKVHDEAHRLEHRHDKEVIGWIDHQLGHPDVDPHGQEIPEEVTEVLAVPILLSELRRGRRAEVVAIKKSAKALSLEKGEVITQGERQKDGTVWTIKRQQGEELQLTHAEADAVVVKRL